MGGAHPACEVIAKFEGRHGSVESTNGDAAFTRYSAVKAFWVTHRSGTSQIRVGGAVFEVHGRNDVTAPSNDDSVAGGVAHFPHTFAEAHADPKDRDVASHFVLRECAIQHDCGVSVLPFSVSYEIWGGGDALVARSIQISIEPLASEVC